MLLLPFSHLSISLSVVAFLDRDPVRPPIEALASHIAADETKEPEKTSEPEAWQGHPGVPGLDTRVQHVRKQYGGISAIGTRKAPPAWCGMFWPQDLYQRQRLLVPLCFWLPDINAPQPNARVSFVYRETRSSRQSRIVPLIGAVKALTAGPGTGWF